MADIRQRKPDPLTDEKGSEVESDIVSPFNIIDFWSTIENQVIS